MSVNDPMLPPSPAPIQRSKVDNNLAIAIFSTLCCCVPFGIASIVYAAQVDGKASSGDYIGAQEAADKAKMWAYLAIGFGLVTGLAYAGLMFAGVIPVER